MYQLIIAVYIIHVTGAVFISNQSLEKCTVSLCVIRELQVLVEVMYEQWVVFQVLGKTLYV